ncbi:16S rRNA (cytosine(1402)-N(4))-methyltransferase [Carbonactinospora thermoautotrophica]|uniref:16S rRNA (cytosine(1402)-N(4))-methyltransferase RsmH n=1 Tax=Carbonactinospora thermoautotrophica TaxID=1469144 RepID=UPI002271ECF4|nr:16S rRNA (cytosine(1402)-N(4))-methyltransferase RsmH [Carbonactinospora thermoautotrophica]MCX9190768.1 16S rRNA (cytosine(1402)-N(4))-methyltransferase [Carbonactinospora thermoautotrophica]
MSGPAHVPVLLERCLALLAPALEAPGSVAVDATVGLGGHSEALLRQHPRLRLVGLDRDPEALRLAGERLGAYGERVTLVHAVYDELPDVLAGLGIDRVQGVLFDLGVSSLQLDEAGRGFAYARDAPLDMRMDPTRGRTAAEVLNTYPVEELTRILREYGEERYARRIAEAVVRERGKEPFTTSGRLVDLVYRTIPAPARRTGGHPAKRTFQALRIEVNAELAVLERALPAAVDALAVGGRIVVLSYHSLEDRLVKRVLTARARSTAPEGLPVDLPEHAPELRLLTRGAEQPGPEEVAANPRAASARLRAAERIRAGARSAEPGRQSRAGARSAEPGRQSRAGARSAEPGNRAGR